MTNNDFELWSLAVSAINGCGKCVDSHEKVVRDRGVSEETVLAVVRVVSDSCRWNGVGCRARRAG